MQRNRSMVPTDDRILTVLNRLEKVKPAGSNKWTACCPAHDDNRPSLSVAIGNDGRILFHCHSQNCSFDKIRKAIDMSKEDLGPANPVPNKRKTNAKKATRRAASPPRRIVKEYDYRDENGELVSQTVRHEPKGFSQRRPHKDGGWTYGLTAGKYYKSNDGNWYKSKDKRGTRFPAARPVLYRLPELMKADPNEWVFFVEGEKDVDRLIELGLVATTIPMGAGKWKNEYAESLEGRKVAILPDNDDPGRKHALKVAQALSGRAAEVRVVELPGLQEKGDVSDWFDAGGAKDQLLELVEEALPYDASQDALLEVDGAESSACIPPNVEILGVDEKGAIWLWVTDRRRIWKIGKLRELDYPMYVQIGGQWVIENIGDDGQPSMTAVKSQIALAARELHISWDKIKGQGVWSHPEDDSILVLSGNQACSFSRDGFAGEAKHTEIISPRVANELLDFDGGRSWCELSKIVEKAASITQDEAKRIYAETQNLLKGWNFQCERDRDVLTGLMIATPLQGCLGFRPQTWLTGGTNTGKSALLTLLGRLFPFGQRFDNETSEAALRQQIGHNALPVFLDEFEKWRGRKAIIKLLRSSTRGGSVHKGTPSGNAIEFAMHHMCYVASIEVGLENAADRNRFIIIELDKPGEIVVPRSSELAELRSDVLALGLAIAMPLRRLAAKLGRVKVDGVDDRLIEALALPAAVYAIVDGMSVDDAEEMLRDWAAERGERIEESSVSDEEQLVEDILSSKMRMDVKDFSDSRDGFTYRDIPVSQALADIDELSSLQDNERQVRRKQLEANGIRLLDDGRIFLVPKTVERFLLKGTRWDGLNIRDILKRLPGAEASKRRIAGQAVNGLILDLPQIRGEEEADDEPSTTDAA